MDQERTLGSQTTGRVKVHVDVYRVKGIALVNLLFMREDVHSMGSSHLGVLGARDVDVSSFNLLAESPNTASGYRYRELLELPKVDCKHMADEQTVGCRMAWICSSDDGDDEVEKKQRLRN